MFSPIEQFSILPLLIFSNFSMFVCVLFLSIFCFSFLPSFILTKHFEYWNSELNNKENGILFIIMTIWFIILISNMMGLIPYSFTLTAQILLVLSITIPTFFSLNLMGLSHHKENLMYLFLPAGVPIFMIPVISFIEMFSYFIRVLSLSLRLTANLVSGHILIKIIIYALLTTKLSIISSFLLIIVIFLELLVAFLQSYVFILLLLSYYTDITVPH